MTTTLHFTATTVEAAPLVHEAPLEVVKPTIKGSLSIGLCSCVVWVQQQIPTFPMGDADEIKANSYPQEGGVVLFQYEVLGHVAIIREIHTDYMLVEETNYHMCQHGFRRVPYTDPHIRGFWAPSP